MSAVVIPFPSRAPFDVVVSRDNEAWLVRVRSHAWLHGDRHSAMRDAHWLARNHGTRIREIDR
jgi:hypothetical protein